MKRIYWAAPLFTPTERAYNAAGAMKLGQAGYEVFLPQEDVGELGDECTRTERRMTRAADISAIEGCDTIIATLEGEALDPGTIYEIGYAHALGKQVFVLCDDHRWTFRRNAMLSTCDRYLDIDDWLVAHPYSAQTNL